VNIRIAKNINLVIEHVCEST